MERVRQAKLNRVLALFLAVLAAFGLFFTNPQEVRADEVPEYYETFADYQKDNPDVVLTWNIVVDEMDKVIAAGKAQYAAGDAKEAYNRINNAYYGWYETTGFERIAMGYISGSRKTEMELQFAACKAVTKAEGTVEEFNAECDLLSAMLREDANKLDGVSGDSSSEDSSGSSSDSSSSSGQRSAAAAAFIACFSIILREGFEAILIVGAIAAYLIKGAADEADRKRKTRPVYAGAIFGIVASFITAAILNAIKLANSASQEVIEGVTALIAVCVLYYVSNWMLNKSETEAWTNYIKSKAEAGAARNSMFALAFTSFLAVYREGAEVILFYQPMLSGDYDRGAVWAGFIVGCICLVFVYLAIHYFSIKLPLKPLFTATSILMFIMSIAFLGSGIKELIEGDVFTIWVPSWVAWIPSHPVLEILGIYPCGQTVIAQLILLAITIIIFVRTKRKQKLEHEQLLAEHPEIAERERLAVRATKQDVVDIVNEKLAEASVMAGEAASGVSREELQKMIEEAVAKALSDKSGN
ncbi:MAG: FTR1 family iron permease [Lachnospiraceae bacterium]|nr:FTR1 family iron permease [Lachnospiraceae bacterium]